LFVFTTKVREIYESMNYVVDGMTGTTIQELNKFIHIKVYSPTSTSELHWHIFENSKQNKIVAIKGLLD